MGDRPLLHGLADAARHARPRNYGRERVPASGGLVYAINHLHWLDVPDRRRHARRATSTSSRRPKPSASRSSAATCAGTARSRCGAASPTATRCGTCARPRATGGWSASSSRGRASARAARGGAARRGDGRDPGGRAGDPGRDLRHAVLEARQLRALLGRLRRADALRRAAEGRARLQGGDRRDRARASTSSSTGSPRSTPGPARARPRRYERARRRARRRAARTGTVAIVGFPNVGKSTLVNRLTSTRAGGRARDARHDARPQGARLRVERQALPADRHGRRRHRRPAARSRARSPSRRARRSRRPTSSSSSSTRAPGSRRATRSSRRSCARRRSR